MASDARQPLKEMEDTCFEDASTPTPQRRRERLKTFATKAPRVTHGIMESTSYEDYWSPQYVDYLTRIGVLSPDFHHFRLFRWVLLAFIGIATGLIAVAVDFSMAHLTELRTRLNERVVEGGASLWQQYLAYVGVCVSFASVAGFLVCYVEVLAAGSGIPEIKCYLNGINFPNVVGVKTLAAKAIGIVFSVSAGLPCGKEGPMIHSGAIVGGLSARGCDVRNTIKPLNIEEEARDLVAAGAAAGVAAAFGAPMGGVLFAVEEGSSHMSPTIMLRAFVACSFATLVSRVFAGFEAGVPIGVLGTMVPVSFGRFNVQSYYIFEFPIFALMAVAGGLLGALFNKVNKRISKWRQRNIGPTGSRRFLEVLAITFIISTMQFFIPVLAFNGATAAVSPKALNTTEALFWKTGLGSMKDIFHLESGAFDSFLLLVFALMNLCTSCITYGLGVPSGLFVPSLLTGATFGRLLGEALLDVGFVLANPGFYALLGAVAMLSGTARITISLALIIVEVTGDATVSLPLFFTVMIGKFVGDAFGRGIYDMHIVELKHIPLLEHEPEHAMITKQAKHIMAEGVVTLDIVCTVRCVLETLETYSHQAFPVLHPRSKLFLGLVNRDVLKSVLRNGDDTEIFQNPRSALKQPPPMTAYEDVNHDEAVFHVEDLDMRIDLSPYVNFSSYTMPDHASVSSCYRLFRQLGLRHLTVLTPDGHVAGMLTRKDLILHEEHNEDGTDVFHMFTESDLEGEEDVVYTEEDGYVVSAESSVGFGGAVGM
eukprot:TRINITY_DN4666_c0_g4_i1.p1 TRINITY_DN4666_c0_g4~~TRINITY_DN4666_c0_g4_i1.p1  ORF type:complete len:766 (-),score=163.32 TRINITY_DN4666_c0_g4_i1:925-3222(-)